MLGGRRRIEELVEHRAVDIGVARGGRARDGRRQVGRAAPLRGLDGLGRERGSKAASDAARSRDAADASL